MTRQPGGLRAAYNALRYATTRPRSVPALLRKAWRRLADPRGGLPRAENRRWVRSQARDPATLAAAKDPALWAEARAFGRRLRERGERALAGIPYELGGGGCYPLLYFLTRLRRPACVVETGVAAGYSTAAFLAALGANGGPGELHSSELPYVRLDRPERYIGAAVPPSLRGRWHLYLDGDANNLPRIVDRVDRIELFHYDSDKSYAGCRFAFECVRSRLSPDVVIVMDDIQDHSFFHDLVADRDDREWCVAAFGGKYVGIVGEF